uniref:Uncharacterized protein n=1 Tax=Arundo donax TaxID=35708 RepID=A0A0A9GI82_ARUDO
MDRRYRNVDIKHRLSSCTVHCFRLAALNFHMFSHNIVCRK